jgi:hypothetical protein
VLIAILSITMGCKKHETETAPPLTPPALTAYVEVDNVALPTNILSAGEQVIERISVSAGPSGDIAWKKIVFRVSTSNATVANLTLVDGANNLVTDCAYENGEVVCASSTDIQIAKGTTKVYSLKAEVTCSAGTASISTFINKTTTVGPDLFSNMPSNASFIWCRMTTGHTESSSDYYNIDGVSGPPLDYQTISK